MTKQQEMDLYDECTLKFGQASYLGPWLIGMRGSVFADIKSDIGPAPLTPAVAYTRAARIVEAARTEAERQLTAAQVVVDGRVKSANDQVATILARGRRWLADAAAEL